MNRRDALKKLGVGTALAATAPVILPSARVAYAASGGLGETGLVGAPEATDSPDWYPVAGVGSDRKREVNMVFDNGAISCIDGSTPEFSVQWRIVSVSFDRRGPKPVRLALVDGGVELATSPLVKGSWSGGSFGAVSYSTTFTMNKLRANGSRELLRPSDTWVLGALCRWHCPGATADLVAEYHFSGSANNPPSVANISWDPTAAA